MIRHIILSAVISLSPCLAQAQEQPVSVYFEPLRGGDLARLNKAVQEALSQPPFQLETKPGPQTVIVSAPDKVEITQKRISGTFYNFTVAFSRDGHSLGQSQQNCGADTLSECTGQIIQDAKTAAAQP